MGTQGYGRRARVNAACSSARKVFAVITYAGRVVYDRAKHFFKRKDVNRIMKAMADEPDERTDFQEWAYNLLLRAGRE